MPVKPNHRYSVVYAGIVGGPINLLAFHIERKR